MHRQVQARRTNIFCHAMLQKAEFEAEELMLLSGLLI